MNSPNPCSYFQRFFQSFTPSDLPITTWNLLTHIFFSFAEPKNWPVFCFQIIFLPDRPIRFWMFTKAYWPSVLCQRTFRSPTSGWRKWKCVASTTAAHPISVNSSPGVWSFIVPEHSAAGRAPSHPGCHRVLCAASQNKGKGGKEGVQGGFTSLLRNEGATVVAVHRKHPPPCGEELKIWDL